MGEEIVARQFKKGVGDLEHEDMRMIMFMDLLLIGNEMIYD
jgi:hypothetical protein